MALPTYNETRSQNTILATTAANVSPTITNNAINKHPGLGIFFGEVGDKMFGPQAMNGKARRYVSGESIEVRVQLGKNDTAKWMASGFEEFSQDTQDTARVTRANWKIGGATAIISGEERRNNSGTEKIADLLQYRLTEAVQSVTDMVAEGLYGGSSPDPNQITGLDSLIGTGSIQGIAGTDYANWNSRGLSAKGTAAASITFTGGSFATTGVSNWITAFMNASEGSIQPEFLLTTEDIVRYYEGGLIPELRYGNTALADGSFQKLAFKSRPVLADSYATSGYTYFVNTDHLYAAVARGADFTTTPLSDQSFQDVFSAKVLFQGNFVVNGRKFQNKVISQVA